jgi:RNA polymerase primary sigma factor
MTHLQTAADRPSASPLANYLSEINETPLLDAGEERALAYRIREGDSAARDHLVRANLRLVVRIARDYLGRGLCLQDLVQEGSLGLMRAVEGFDPDMGTRFSTYASYWIKQSIKRGLENTAKTIRIPAYMLDLLNKWRRETARLQEELGRPPSQEEVARVLNLSRKKLNIIKKAIRIYNSVPQNDQADSAGSLDQTVLDGQTTAPDTEMARTEELDQVLRLLDTLPQREAQVLRLRFGLVDGGPRTLHEIGKRLNLTRERVRQIERDALARLRDLLEPDESGAPDGAATRLLAAFAGDASR